MSTDVVEAARLFSQPWFVLSLVFTILVIWAVSGSLNQAKEDAKLLIFITGFVAVVIATLLFCELPLFLASLVSRRVREYRLRREAEFSYQHAD